MRSWTWCALLIAAACTSEPPPPPKKAPPVKMPTGKSAWKEIETPVPVGKKLACAALLPADKVQAALGKKYEIVDESAHDPNATSVCRLVAVGRKGKLGDELCMVTVYCWAQFNVGDIMKKCTAGGERTSTDIGAFTCIRTVPAGTKERHVITVLEPDTRCKIVVNAGPYVYEEARTRACAQAVVDIVDRDSLKR